MADRRKVLVDSSGRPMMRGDKVLLDVKCCGGAPTHACFITIVADCQEDGTYGAPYIAYRRCYDLKGYTEVQIKNLMQNLGLSSWKKNWKNQLEITYASLLDAGKSCEQCYSAELGNLALTSIPPVPSGFDCDCDVSVSMSTLTPPRYWHRFPFWRLSATLDSGDPEFPKVEDRRYYYWEYKEFESQLAAWRETAISINKATLEWLSVAEVLDLTNNYDGSLISDAGRYDNDRVYEKLFTVEVAGKVDLPNGSKASYHDRLTIQKLYSYDILPDACPDMLRHYARVIRAEHLDESLDWGVQPDQSVLIPNGGNSYALLDVSYGTSDTKQVIIRNFGNITIIPVETDSSSHYIDTYKVLDSMSSGGMKYYTGTLELLQSGFGPEIRIQGTVLHTPSTKGGGALDTIPVDRFDIPSEHSMDSGEGKLELASLMFGFQYEIGIATDLDPAKILWEQVKGLKEDTSKTTIEDGLVCKCLVNIEKCLEQKFLYTRMWRAPDCTTDSRVLPFPFGAAGEDDTDYGKPGWSQVIDGPKAWTKTDTLLHENEDTDFDEGGGIVENPTLRTFNPETDNHAYYVTKLSYLNFPEWCEAGCPSGAGMGELTMQAVPTPATSGADMCYLKSNFDCTATDACDFWCWPGSRICLNKEYPNAVVEPHRIVNPLPTIDWSSGLLKREGGDEEYEILFKNKIEVDLKSESSLNREDCTFTYKSSALSLQDTLTAIRDKLTSAHAGKTIYLGVVGVYKSYYYTKVVDVDSSYESIYKDTVAHNQGPLYHIATSSFLRIPTSVKEPVGLGCISSRRAYCSFRDIDIDNTNCACSSRNTRFGNYYFFKNFYVGYGSDVGADEDALFVFGMNPCSSDIKTEDGKILPCYTSEAYLVAFAGPSRLCREVDGTIVSPSTNVFLPLPIIGEIFSKPKLLDKGDIVPYSRRWKNLGITINGNHWFEFWKGYVYAAAHTSVADNVKVDGRATIDYNVEYKDIYIKTVGGLPSSIDSASIVLTASANITSYENYSENPIDAAGSVLETKVSSFKSTAAYQSTEYPNHAHIQLYWRVGDDLVPIPVVFLSSFGYYDLYSKAQKNLKIEEATGRYENSWPRATAYAGTSKPGLASTTVSAGDPYSVNNIYDTGFNTCLPYDGYFIASRVPTDEYGGTLQPSLTIEGEWPKITVRQQIQAESAWKEETATSSSMSNLEGKAAQGIDITITIEDLDRR